MENESIETLNDKLKRRYKRYLEEVKLDVPASVLVLELRGIDEVVEKIIKKLNKTEK